MKILHNLSIKPFNTMGLDIKAQTLYLIEEKLELSQLWQEKKIAARQVCILGGGSNIIFTRAIKAPILKIETKGIELVEQTTKGWLIRVEAGEIWHDLVRWTLDNGYFGLENLAFIPGTVGGAPVQNIGAYGSELLQFFDSLEGFDLEVGEFRTLGAEECQFGYRHSIFKQIAPSTDHTTLFASFVITRVYFFIPKPWRPNLTYKEIQKKIKVSGNSSPNADDLYHWIGEIRARKLPDPKIYGNVGSFFKNPILPKSQCFEILEHEPSLVYYELDSKTCKLAAGSLIELCGWKGKSMGSARVYDKHALVLINAGTPERPCKSAELLSLARAIQTSVQEKFGVDLEFEPMLFPDILVS